jgi:pyridoxal phosphate enzyme (YggS family)
MDVSKLVEVRGRIAAAAEAAARPPGSVRLVVVSKGRSVTDIKALYDAGQRDFGENRAQEFAAKVDQLPADIRWHFVGTLQRNKVRRVRPAVVMLHSLDRMSLATAWMKGPGVAPPVLLQVHLGDEPTKHGFAPDALLDAVAEIAGMGLDVRGLMTIPPPAGDGSGDPGEWFARLAELGARIRPELPHAVELSMGMTDDFETAISHGATIVRVGRAIFGPVPVERG